MSKRNKLKEMSLTAPKIGKSQRKLKLPLSEQGFGKIQENLGLS
ncbi:MAG: hypothetical protein ABH840_03830 [Nanoarchaeota archaeon]